MLSAKLDDEQSLVAKAQKNIKELQARVEAAEEELEAERQARAKAERQRSDMAREIEQLGERYDEASGATVAQVELNKKREAEIVKLRKDVEEANKGLVDTLNAANKKVDAANLTLGDFGMTKNKIANENGELLRIVGDLENNLNMLAKAKAALAAQLNDIKALCDNEARERQLLLGKYRNLEHELDLAKEALDEEVAGRDNILRLNAKAEGDANAMRQKYETDAVAKAEELEMTKMKLSARNTEAEAAIDNL